MLGPLHGALASALVYAALCAVATVTGRGVLRLLGLRTTPHLLLSAVLGLVAWSLAVGIVVGLQVPVKLAAPWLWAGTAALALNGLRGPWPDLRASGPALLLCAALPPIAMAPHFAHGLSDYMGSTLPDGWSYVAVAQYVWERVRGADGAPVPLHQYAQHLSGSRYISSSLLAFLSPIAAPGDPQAVSALYQAWVLFAAAAAVAAFAMAAGLPAWMVLASTALTTVSGWTANLVWANNFDNELALAYMPALAAALRLGPPGEWRWSVLRGALLAGLWYSYPELALAVMGGAVLIALPHCLRGAGGWRAWFRETITALAVACLLLIPGAATLVSHLPQQLRSAAEIRPGQTFFTDLLQPRLQPGAFWGLGPEHPFRRHRLRNLAGAGLSLVAIVGLTTLCRRGEWGMVSVTGLFTMGAAWMIWGHRYAYGAYKFLILEWWCLALALIAGAAAIAAWPSRPPARAALALAAAIALSALPLASGGDPRAKRGYLQSASEGLSMAELRQVERIASIVGPDGVAIAVDDWVASEWAVYYLRDVRTQLLTPTMYMAMPHVAPLLFRGPVDVRAIRYVLTGAGRPPGLGTGAAWRPRWANAPFTLWERVERSGA